MAVDAEVERSEGYAPGRVEPVAVFEAAQKSAIGGEDIDEAQAWTVGFKGLAFLVEDEGDDDVVADGLDIEGHKVPGKTIVAKGPVSQPGLDRSIPVWPQIDLLKALS